MIEMVSFGYRWRNGVEGATVTVDVRRRLRDPNIDPEFRKLTARDQAVRDKVRATPGADEIVAACVCMILAMKARGERLVFALGCVGGKHRSASLAEDVSDVLSNLGETVSVRHMDIDSPVVESQPVR